MNNLKNSSVDPKEIASFNNQAHTWWQSDGPFRPLHQLNPTRLKFIRDQVLSHFNLDHSIREPFGSLRMIDIGCGGGLLAEPLARLGAQVTAIDAGDENIEVAQKHAKEMNLTIDYRVATAEEIAATGAAFDVVISLEVVEHVADVEGFLAACSSLVKPGGLLVLSTLNRTLKSFALGIVGAEYLLRWVPRGTHQWQKFLAPSELARYLRKSGLEVCDTKGLTFKPISNAWELSDDLSVNYLLCGRKSA